MCRRQNKRHNMRTDSSFYREMPSVIGHTKYSTQYMSAEFSGWTMCQRLRWDRGTRSEEGIAIRHISAALSMITHCVYVVVSVVPVY